MAERLDDGEAVTVAKPPGRLSRLLGAVLRRPAKLENAARLSDRDRRDIGLGRRGVAAEFEREIARLHTKDLRPR